MDDSFAERMRNRALQRIQKNSHLIKQNTGSAPIKQMNIIQLENKENHDNDDSEVTKPVIAEHLIIKKSAYADKMDCDGPRIATKMRKPNEFSLSENNYNFETNKEDVYVKNCKRRLADLAGKFKCFEEEKPLEQRPAVIQTTSTYTSRKEDEAKNCKRKMIETVPKPLSRPVVTQNTQMPGEKPKRKEDAPTEIKRPAMVPSNIEKAKRVEGDKLLDRSVVQSLESQGYKRTESDAHLIFDFKKARSVFNKDEESSTSKAVSVTDPCLLSVAERRKLFERRLRGEDVEPNSVVAVPEKSFTSTNVKNGKSSSPQVPVQPEQVDEKSAIESEESDSESSIVSSEHPHEEAQEKPALNISEETCSSFPDSSNDQDTDLSVSTYPVLQTVKQVKFVSTPKPGRLYPSISDLDSDGEEPGNKKNKKNDDEFSITDHDNSFGRDVLCATNSIFSSFQTSRKEASEFLEKSAINEAKELVSAGKETSLSLRPFSPTSVHSVECPNETASFTYLKNYSDLSIDASPIPFAARVQNINKVESDDKKEAAEETDESKNGELSVDEKIKLLEEEIVKEKIKLTQAVRALKLCLSTSFLNSLSHLETEKVVLLSQLRISAAQEEIARMKVENSVQPHFSGLRSARGDIVISNIKLPLKRDVILSDLKDHICNNLLCIIKCGDIVLSTEVVPVVQSRVKREPDSTSYVEFSDTIFVPNINSNFKISIDVYNLAVKGKDTANSKKDKKNAGSSKKDKESKFFSKNFHEDKKHGHSFVKAGYMIFSLNEVRRHQWTLNMQNLHHPLLVGMIEMNVKCNLALTSVRKHGFLTMYEVISGYGAWSRHWFYLSGDKLAYWKYPEEEAVKDPIGTIDIKNCITNLVDVVGIEITMRPHTFMIKFDPPSYLLNFKGLVEDGLLLSADNLEERIEWCSCLNEVLQSIRLWSNRAN